MAGSRVQMKKKSPRRAGGEQNRSCREDDRHVSVRTVRRTRGVVGESVRRVDGVPKVKGAFLFGRDLWAEGMLWGYTVRSPHPSARIRSIDISKALARPGVAAVLVAQDGPGKKTYGLEFADPPVLAWDRGRDGGGPG